MFDLNVLCIKCHISKTIDPDLGIKCLLYKMSLMSFVTYHTKSEINVFVSIFVVVDSLTKIFPGLFMSNCLTLRCSIVLIVIFMNYSCLWFTCLMNKTVQLMHNTKSDIRGLVCIYISFFVTFIRSKSSSRSRKCEWVSLSQKSWKF